MSKTLHCTHCNKFVEIVEHLWCICCAECHLVLRIKRGPIKWKI